jgi:DNA-directed RNA polymerase subunit RPC12/RpoP
MGVGVSLMVVGIVSIVSSIRQDAVLDCPYCGGKVVPRVKSSTSELYLTTVEEEEKRGVPGCTQEETK